MLRLAGVFLIGIGVFVGANVYQSGQWNDNYQRVPNLFGQFCGYDTCYRPEWLAVGFVLLFIGAWMFVANRQLPDLKGAFRAALRFALKNRIGLMVTAALIGSMVWLSGLGSVTASASFSDRCPSEKPILLALRNLTIGAIEAVYLNLTVKDVNGTSHSEILTTDSPLGQFQSYEECIATSYTNTILNQVGAVGGGEFDLSATIEQANRRIELTKTSNVVVSVLYYN